MKINGQYSKLPVQEKNVSKNLEKEAVGKSHKSASKPGEVSGSGNQDFAVKRLQAKIASEPDLDMEKVKQLKDKIRKGDYQVDSGKLAKNLIKNSIIEDI